MMILHQLFHNLNYDFENNGESWVAKMLSDNGINGIFFDVGANVGNWTLCINSLCRPRRIYCFEPIPSTFMKLKHNTKDVHNVVVKNLGLSSQSGSLDFAFNKTTDVLSSAVPDVFQHIHKAEFETIACQVCDGDTYCANAGISEIDFLKIDTEGHEGSVIDGFKAMISTSKINVIQFEYGMANIYSGYLLRNIYKTLAGAYVIGKIYPDFVEFKDYSPQDEDFLGPNYLAVSKTRGDLIKLLS